MSDEEKERRRYALLQTAALVMGHAMGTKVSNEILAEGCVDAAELLLAEIERREKETDVHA